MRAHPVAFGTAIGDPNIKESPETPEAFRGNRLRVNEATLEIPKSSVSDEAIQGLVADLIVPLIVDRVLQRTVGYTKAPEILRAQGYYEHNNLGEAFSNGEKPKGRAAAEASSAEADTAAPIVVDERRIQVVKRIRNAAEFDGK